MTLLLALLCGQALAGPYGPAKRACKKTDDIACIQAALQALDAGEARALDLVVSRCQPDRATLSCEAAAVWLIQGTPATPPDLPRALLVLTVLCEDGAHAGACLDLGTAYEQGIGGPANPDQALRFFGLACELGDQQGCRAQRALALLGEDLEFDEEPLPTGLCSAGDGPSCLKVAEALIPEGRTAEALPPVRSGCEVRSAEACLLLGTWYAEAVGVPQDAEAALLYFERACLLESAEGCARGAALLGTALPADPARASKLQAQACRLDAARCAASPPP